MEGALMSPSFHTGVEPEAALQSQEEQPPLLVCLYFR